MASEGHQVRQQIIRTIGQIDNSKQTVPEPSCELARAVKRLSYSNMLSTLFQDDDQQAVSQAAVAKAYYNVGCIKRAIKYGMVALRSGRLSAEQANSIEIVLIKCFLEVGNLEQAADRLQKMELTDNVMEVHELSIQCMIKQKDYEEALKKHEAYLSILVDKYGNGSQEYALALIEKGKILGLIGSYFEAEETQQLAIEILICLSYSKVDVVANLYVSLAEYQRKNSNYESEYSSLIKARNILSEISDPQTSIPLLNVRKQLARNLQNRCKFYECLKEWNDIREVQKTIYGQITVQVAKTQRKIGQLLVQSDKTNHGNPSINAAIKHFLRAICIFQENGDRKTAAELQTLVRQLRQRKGIFKKRMQSAYSRS